MSDSQAMEEEPDESGIASLSLGNDQEEGAVGGRELAWREEPPSAQHLPSFSSHVTSTQHYIMERLRALEEENRKQKEETRKQKEEIRKQKEENIELRRRLEFQAVQPPSGILLYVDPAFFSGGKTCMHHQKVSDYLMKNTAFYPGFCHRVDPVLVLPHLNLPADLEEFVVNLSRNINKLTANRMMFGYLRRQTDWPERLARALKEGFGTADLSDMVEEAVRSVTKQDTEEPETTQEHLPTDHQNLHNGMQFLKTMGLMDPRSPQALPEENGATSAEPQARTPTERDIVADNAKLFRICRLVEANLAPEDVRSMFRQLPKSSGKTPQSAEELLVMMTDKQLVSPYDVVFLQALLWAVGRKNLFKQVAELVKEIYGMRENQRMIAHLDVPSLEPINGYKYVEFHVHTEDARLSESLVMLRDQLIDVLMVPQEFVKYINIVSVKIVQSILVVIAMPTFVSHRLLNHFYRPDIQQTLANLRVDYVVFHHNCELSVPSKPSTAEGVPCEGVPGTDLFETDRPKDLSSPAAKLSTCSEKGNKDKRENATSSPPVDEKVQLDRDEITLLKSLETFYKPGRVFVLPGKRQSEARPPSSPSSSVFNREQTALSLGRPHSSTEIENFSTKTWEPSHPDENTRRVMELLRDRLQEETAPGDPPAFLLCDPRLPSLAVPETNIILVLHWRLGVVLVAVEKGADLTGTAALLREARLSLLEELQGVVSGEAVTLAIAFPGVQTVSSGDKARAELEGDVELLLGSEDSNYQELVTNLKQRWETHPPFTGSSVEERQRSFKLSFVRHCKIPQTTPSSTSWLLPTPEQQSALCSADRLVTVEGPLCSGKTTVLVERARLWLKQGHRVAVVSHGRQRDRLQKALIQDATSSICRLVWCSSMNDLIKYSSRHPHVIVDNAEDENVHDIFYELNSSSFLLKIVVPWSENTRRLQHYFSTTERAANIVLTRSWSILNNMLPWVNRLRDKGRDPELEAKPTDPDDGDKMEPVLICHSDHTMGESWEDCSECSTRLHDALSRFGLPVKGQPPCTVDYSKAVVVVIGNEEDDSLDNVITRLKSMGLPVENRTFSSVNESYAAADAGYTRKWRDEQQHRATEPNKTGNDVLRVFEDFEFKDQEHSLALLVLSDSFWSWRDWDDARQRVYQTLCRCRGHVIVLAPEETPVITLLSGASSRMEEALKKHEHLQVAKRRLQYMEEATRRRKYMEEATRRREAVTMATGGADAIAPLLEELLTCVVCEEEFNSFTRPPRVLPCYHIFCGVCLQKLTKDGKVKCPKCRQEAAADKPFQMDPLRVSLMDWKQSVLNVEGKTCEGCSVGAKATSKCQDCAEYYCSDCTSCHRNLKVFRDHTLVSLSEATKSPENLIQTLSEKCHSHPDKRLELFCLTCDKAVCSICALTQHMKGHKFVELQKVVEDKKKKALWHPMGMQQYPPSRHLRGVGRKMQATDIKRKIPAPGSDITPVHGSNPSVTSDSTGSTKGHKTSSADSV